MDTKAEINGSRASREEPFRRYYGYIIGAAALGMGLFHCYTALWGLMIPATQRAIHLTFALVLILLTQPIKLKPKALSVLLNIILLAAAIVSSVYIIIRGQPANVTKMAISGLTQTDVVMGFLMILAMLEATRRATGMALPILGILFICYALYGGNLPGILGHRGYSISTVVDQLLFGPEGVFGEPLGVSATFIALFILFGAFLEISGAGQWFIDISYALTGTTRSGPAMTAVVSSAILGTISGTGVANVVTTGAFTIPLMKSCGYKPDFAGAVEATASTGGQIMPPIMGAGAFILAEMLGKPYGEVAIAALLPSILYFFACGMQVHLEACKMGFKGLPKEQLPPLKATFLKGIVFIIPLAVLIWCLVIKMYSATYSALISISVIIAVSVILKRSGERMTPRDICKALISGAKGMVPVAMACAVAGIMIGMLLRTGLALKFTTLLTSMAGDSVITALLLTMVVCVILGMGLPTTAAFIVTATLGAPFLVGLKVEPIAAYLFVFYFAAISAITPPVALAAFAAAGISGASPMRTGLIATRLGIAGFVVPYFFCFNSALLFVGSGMDIFLASATALAGVGFLATAIAGYGVASIAWYERIVMAAGSLLLVHPGLTTDIIGVGLCAVGTLPMIIRYRKERT